MLISTHFCTSIQLMFLSLSCQRSGIVRIFSTRYRNHNTCANRNYGLFIDQNLLLNLLDNSTLNICVLKHIFLLSSSYIKATVCRLNIASFRTATKINLTT
jgi:hypothetical protein